MKRLMAIVLLLSTQVFAASVEQEAGEGMNSAYARLVEKTIIFRNTCEGRPPTDECSLIKKHIVELANEL